MKEYAKEEMVKNEGNAWFKRNKAALEKTGGVSIAFQQLRDILEVWRGNLNYVRGGITRSRMFIWI